MELHVCSWFLTTEVLYFKKAPCIFTRRFFLLNYMSRYKNFINVFEKAVIDSGRNITDIELIAVSKTKSENEIKSVISEGHSSFEKISYRKLRING